MDWDDTHLYRYKATVDRVLDGDTIYCWVDLGMKNKVYKEIRVVGMDGAPFDAPEIKLYAGVTPEEKAQGLKAKKLAEDLMPAGSVIRLVSHKDSTGKYGRLLATPWVQCDDGDWYDYVVIMQAQHFDTGQLDE